MGCGVEIFGAPFKPAIPNAGGKGHVALVRRHAQMREHGAEMGVIKLIKDDKAGVHRDIALPVAHIQGAGMAAQTIFFLIDRDVMRPAQQVSAAQS